MGKEWDGWENPAAFQRWCTAWTAECLRVLKPGGHLLAFGGTRTWHRLAVAVEDAGFELRDSIAWMYGSGFPKSLDVSKAIDKAAGATPIDTGIRSARHGGGVVGAGSSYEVSPKVPNITRPATPEAERWQGWGTALKPSHEPVVWGVKPLTAGGSSAGVFEPIVVGRKPLIGTVAANVLAHGTGGINVDACRIGDEERTYSTDSGMNAQRFKHGARPADYGRGAGDTATVSGRWPANVVLDESMAAELGDPSRFMYVAKAGKKERPVVDGVAHPTVKPIALMRWLCRLVTPPGGRILEPFAGSGTTIEAAMLEGFDIVAIERETEYLPLIQARIDRAKAELGEVVA